MRRILNYVLTIALLITLACILEPKWQHTLPVVQKKEAENAILRRQCDSLRTIVKSLQIEAQTHDAVIDSLLYQITQNTLKINENRNQYEKEVVRIDRMLNDSVYLFFTEYIAKY